ncbi:MAG: hypothetical protein JXB30_00235 [Anaerolineae bacterium]|nr:hypothetical protein [Anaerolineae bacterium]
MSKKQYLHLDSLTTRPELAQRLPSEVAFRYHALPIAGQEGNMTVALADPDDMSAYSAICEALGTRPYIIKGDQEAIDTLLTEVWQLPERQPLHILVYDHHHHTLYTPDDLWQYATSVSERLKVNPIQTQSRVLPEDAEQAGCDLVVMSKVKPDLARLVISPLETQITYRLSTSLLVIHHPVWPLRKILLLTCCNEINEPALNWVLKLAKSGDIGVTQLLVTPHIPSSHHDGYIEALLSPNTEMGSWLRLANQRFAQWCIPSDIKIRQGEPAWQVEQELDEQSYELVVVMAGKANNGLQRSPEDKLLSSLWRLVNCPVLVAR